MTIVPTMDARSWRQALGSLARNLRHKAFVQELVMSGLRFDAAPKAALVPFFKMYPEASNQVVPMGDVQYSKWNMDPIEQYYLGAIAQVRRPQKIFEIGTFDGATSLFLARVVPDARIYTLDLPQEDLADKKLALGRAHARAASRFGSTAEADRITQLYGDSREFDFSPYYDKIDLVIVDGSHEADCVIPDTENALRMVAPGGMVVWDDYVPRRSSLVAAVDNAAKRHGLLIIRLRDTGFAVYDTTKSTSEGHPETLPR
jgi:predicted O-methyltransferase YrrM